MNYIEETMEEYDKKFNKKDNPLLWGAMRKFLKSKLQQQEAEWRKMVESVPYQNEPYQSNFGLSNNPKKAIEYTMYEVSKKIQNWKKNALNNTKT